MAQAETIRSRSNGLAREALKARASDVMDDFVELRKDVSKLAHAADKAARAEVKHAGKRLNTMRADMRDRAQHGVDSITERVRERPGAAMGVSLGVGLLIGLLFARK